MVWIVIFALALCGCEGKAEEAKNGRSILRQTVSGPQIMTESTEAKTAGAVRVQVAMHGFSAKEEKKVFFSGNNANGDFHVVNAKSREHVYSGKILETAKGWTGDFSAVTEEGVYYVEAPGIGRSFEFSIANDVLSDLQKEIETELSDRLKSIAAKKPTGEDEVITYAKTLQWLSRISYKDKQMVTRIADKMKAGRAEAESELAKANYIAGIAMASDLLSETDEKKAAEYRKEAEENYRMLVQSAAEDDKAADGRFLAATVLYRTTGNGVYHSAIKNYLAGQTERETNPAMGDPLSQDAYIFGILTYLDTEAVVDQALCEQQMNKLLRHVRKTAEDADANAYGLLKETEDGDVLLKEYYLLTVIEQTIVSREYVLQMTEGIRYLDGVNRTGEEYLLSIKQPDLLAGWLYVLTEINQW